MKKAVSFFSSIRDKIRFLYFKMVREKASPEYIARGWAIGMFWGLAAPLGAQLFFSIPCAFLLKGSKIGAVLGTFPITNLISVIFIYPAQCWIGNRILGGNLTLDAVKDTLKHILHEPSLRTLLQALQDLSWDMLFAFLAGGVLFGLIVAIPTYYGVLALVKRHRLRKRR
jgi:uncharacterized protein (DUF2062 family)